MANYTNRQILAAVLNKWLQPALQQMAGAKLMQMPFLANIEAKIKSTGWVSPMWNMGNEIAPLLGGVSNIIIEPMLSGYLRGVPDNAIPSLAHTIVDNAIANNGISLFEGNIVLEKGDLEELKNLLRYNLPITEENRYKVKNDKNEEL